MRKPENLTREEVMCILANKHQRIFTNAFLAEKFKVPVASISHIRSGFVHPIWYGEYFDEINAKGTLKSADLPGEGEASEAATEYDSPCCDGHGLYAHFHKRPGWEEVLIGFQCTNCGKDYDIGDIDQ